MNEHTRPMDPRPVAVRPVWEMRDGQWRQTDVASVREEPLAIDINGNRIALLMRLPGQEKELALGFCLSEGIVRGFEDVLLIAHSCDQDGDAPEKEAGMPRNLVEMRVTPDAILSDARLEAVRLIRAGCGSTDLAVSELPLQPVTSALPVPASVVLSMPHVLRNDQLLHNAVGGVHDAALFDREGRLLALAEDVGRHNAVDKALGHCLLEHIPLEDPILLCSGRLSYEMVLKAVRMRLPILASISAPTSLGIELADRYGITLVAYVRGRRMTVYTHPERILRAEDAPEVDICGE